MGKYACIRAICGYLPEKVEQNDPESRIAKKTGVFSKHNAAGASAGDLAAAAAERLFADYGIARESVDFVLLCTQHPDYQMPTTACIVQDRLGLAKSCGALDYNLGCSGYVYGLSLAKGLLESGLAKRVLLLASSIYLQYINEKDDTLYPFFGDGATATLLECTEAVQPLLDAFVFGTDGSGAEQLMIPAGGSRHPYRETPEVFTTDQYGNVRSNYELFMDGQEVMAFTLREVPELIRQVLSKAGMEKGMVDYYVFHQANAFILGYIQKKCRLVGMPFYNDAHDVGNTVSSSIPLALEQILRQKKGTELRHVMLAGFGVGLSWAGCMADFSQMMEKK